MLTERIIKTTYLDVLKIVGRSTVHFDKYIYEYKKDRLIKIVRYVNDTKNKEEYKLFGAEIISYNEKNKIASITTSVKNKSNPVDEIIEIQYDTNLNPIKRIVNRYNPFPNKNKMEQAMIVEYSYEKNRLVKVIKNFPRDDSRQNFFYDYSSNDKVIVTSENTLNTLTYSKGLLIKKLENHIGEMPEYKYSEEAIEYDNRNRFMRIISCSYNDPSDKNKNHSMWDKVTEFFYDAPIKAKVIVSDNLRVRKEPSIVSEKLILIPSNELVEVIQKIDNQTEINGKIGKWVKIKWKSHEGWVFDAYLKYE